MSSDYNEDYYTGKNSNYGFLGGYSGRLIRTGRYIKSKCVISTLSKYGKSGKLLDVGCAYGFISNNLSRSGFDVVGIDISEHAIKVAKSKFPHIKFIKRDIQLNTEFENNEFDFIVALDVLEHCQNVDSAIEEINRILKKDGILLLSIPTTDFHKKIHLDESHNIFLSLEGWYKKLSEYEFRVIEKRIGLGWLKLIKRDWCFHQIILKKPIHPKISI